jgi:hypothetical protein
VKLAIGAQVPVPFTLQAWQTSQAETVQQTPSVQKPLAHSPPPAQAAPADLRTH